jgi:hypothetical protein
MKNEQEFMATRGVTFFGEVTAVISHELKNVLATVSETAGLLGDLLEGAEAGAAIDAAELRSCSETITEEIQRGFGVVANLNRFAHSTDEPIRDLVLEEIVDLVVKVSRSLSFSRKLDLAPLDGIDGTVITANSIAVQYLVYRALVIAYRSVGMDDELAIATTPDPAGSRVVISGIGSTSDLPEEIEHLTATARHLGAEVTVDSSGRRLILLFPPGREATQGGDDSREGGEP